MKFTDLDDIWLRGNLLPHAFKEYQACLRDIYSTANSIIHTLPPADNEFHIEMGEIPKDFFIFPRNIFSTLFQSLYRMLAIGDDRRHLYGKLNHLFRIWVTSADNLLDGEDKVVVPMRLPGHSRVMHQVIAIMAADRLLFRLLSEATRQGIITQEETILLSDQSLQILLPSAAEEASEESGVEVRPDPDYVLFTIHRLKTGMLFQIPFLGPERIEKAIPEPRLREGKEALVLFGLGCQLLDDIRDMAKDHLEKRHNYVLSRIYYERHTDYLTELIRLSPQLRTETKIYSYFPEVVFPTAERARNLLMESLGKLQALGLGVEEKYLNLMADSMFTVLDVGDLKR